ncbi:glycosyl transferase [alpha proteobacterium U9-1i]|nr:glycosyl transferase [alpha proteobacterium U9-1i]
MLRVDVAIPCYKYAHFLQTAVASVLMQRDAEVRVLILDDCSPDNTEEVAGRLVRHDSRVAYSRNEKNLGLVGTANRGVIDWAEADFNILLSADDALAPGALARAGAVFQAHPELGMVYGMGLVRPNNAIDGVEDQRSRTYQVISSGRFLERATTVGNPALSPAVIVRTDLQKRIGGYNPSLPHTCDMEMWMRFAAEAPVGVLKEVQAIYAEHGGNMSAGYANRSLGDSRQRIAASDEVFAKYHERFPQSTQWRAAQKRRLVDEAYWLAGQCAMEGDKAAVEICLAFAEEHFPDDWRSQAYWRFRVKEAMGKAGGDMLRRLRGDPAAPAQSNEPKVFGWWPD